MRFLKGHVHRKAVHWVVEDCGYESPCWLWSLRRNKQGYGLAQGTLAHRAVYLDSGREIPEGFELDHLCLVKACVNPDHLEPVTKEENMRRANQWRLPDATVDAIRRATGTQSEIAERFGVSRSHVSLLQRGLRRPTWPK